MWKLGANEMWKFAGIIFKGIKEPDDHEYGMQSLELFIFRPIGLLT